ncbi:MAG: choice-of-anchor A family protein [Ilumatobacteraceae bacterium]
MRVQDVAQPWTGTMGVERAGLVDFGDAMAKLRQASSALTGVVGVCTDAAALVTYGSSGGAPWSGSGDVWIELAAGSLNVFDTSLAQMASIVNANFASTSAPIQANTAILVNVTDAGALNFTPPLWTQSIPAFVMWNFPNATSITLNGPMWGTIFAPFADVTAHSDLRGNVVAQTLTVTGGSMDWDRRYTGIFPWDPWGQT